MSNADKIRAALGTARMTSTAIAAASGVPLKAVSVFLAAGQHTGEITKHGDEQPFEFSRDPDYKPRARSTRKKAAKRPKRLKGFKAQRRAQKQRKTPTLRDIAQRPGLSAHALENYLGATELLVTTIEQEVEGLDKNPLLAAALKNHKRAAQMFSVTRGA